MQIIKSFLCFLIPQLCSSWAPFCSWSWLCWTPSSSCTSSTNPCASTSLSGASSKVKPPTASGTRVWCVLLWVPSRAGGYAQVTHQPHSDMFLQRCWWQEPSTSWPWNVPPRKAPNGWTFPRRTRKKGDQATPRGTRWSRTHSCWFWRRCFSTLTSSCPWCFLLLFV